ncbi:MAG: AMP-binding protein, partial [Mycobacterium sp.]
MSTPVITDDQATITTLLAPLAEVDDRGVYFEDTFVSWRDHIAAGSQLAAALWARLGPDRPPHVGVLAGNTPFFSTLLVAAALTGVVPVGLNPTRRGAALQRDIAHADCQLVLTDGTAGVEIADAIDVESPSWASELAGYAGAPVSFRDADPDDLFMLIFTSGTSGD